MDDISAVTGAEDGGPPSCSVERFDGGGLGPAMMRWVKVRGDGGSLSKDA